MKRSSSGAALKSWSQNVAGTWGRGVFLLVLVFAVVGCGSRPSSPGGGPAAKYRKVHPAIPGEYLVLLPDGAAVEQIPNVAGELVRKYGGRLTSTYTAAFRGFAVEGLSENEARVLASDDRVTLVEQVAQVHPAGERNPARWALDRIDERARQNPRADRYRYSADGAGVRVYVIDSGIEATHSEFSPNRVVFGFDAYGGMGEDCSGHGTGVAGIIGGRNTGVAPAVTIVNVKALNCALIGMNTQKIADAIDWVTANVQLPAVANLSLQLAWGASSPSIEKAVKALIQRGVIVVAAAGNDNKDASSVQPGNLPGVIAVGASTESDKRWLEPPPASLPTGCAAPPPPKADECGSNFGPSIALFAPGHNVRTSTLGGAYDAVNGTSAAAAFVSGVAAGTWQAILPLFEPGMSYAFSPQELTTRTMLANVTQGVLTDIRTSPNRLLFAESWPVETLVNKLPKSSGGLTAVAANHPLRFLVSGGFNNKFDESSITAPASPFALQAYDRQGAALWTPANGMGTGGCTDAFDDGITHVYIACTQLTNVGFVGWVRAIDNVNGTVKYQRTVGLDAAADIPGSCPVVDRRSIARSVRVDGSGEVYVVGEAWCANGVRAGFLTKLHAKLDPTLVYPEVRIPGTSGDSGAYTLELGAGTILVGGYNTSGSPSVRRAFVHRLSVAGQLLGVPWILSGSAPSAAYSVFEDSVSQDVYVAGLQQTGPDAPDGFVTRLTLAWNNVWSRTLNGARVYGIGVEADGVYAVGGTRRVLPSWPVTDSLTPSVVGNLYGLGEYRGFMVKLDASSGALRWTRHLRDGHAAGLALHRTGLTGGDVLLRVVGNELPPQCVPRPGVACLQLPTASFIRTYKVN